MCVLLESNMIKGEKYMNRIPGTVCPLAIKQVEAEAHPDFSFFHVVYPVSEVLWSVHNKE